MTGGERDRGGAIRGFEKGALCRLWPSTKDGEKILDDKDIRLFNSRSVSMT